MRYKVNQTKYYLYQKPELVSGNDVNTGILEKQSSLNIINRYISPTKILFSFWQQRSTNFIFGQNTHVTLTCARLIHSHQSTVLLFSCPQSHFLVCNLSSSWMWLIVTQVQHKMFNLSTYGKVCNFLFWFFKFIIFNLYFLFGFFLIFNFLF